MALEEDLRERILADIDGGVGIDGREDEGEAGDLFRELRFQRKAIARAEQKAALGEEVGGDEAWPWESLLEVSRDYLVETGKDLDAAAIMLEAFTRVEGLPGLVGGLTLVGDLVERYWEAGLYPREDDEDGVEARFQPLSGLSGGGSDKEGTLIAPLRRMLIAGDPATGELRYQDRVVAVGQLATAQTLAPDQRKAVTAEAEGTLADIEALAKRLPRAQLVAAQGQVEAAEATWRRTIGYISERTKPRFPAASKVTDELRAMRDWVAGLVKLLPEEAATEETAPAAGVPAPAVDDGATAAIQRGGPFTVGEMATRQDALRAVSGAATFFERYEPLSPVGSALREVIRRAGMSFTDLVAELIPDNGSRETFYWRSGIKPPGSDGLAAPAATATRAPTPAPAAAAPEPAAAKASDGW